MAVTGLPAPFTASYNGHSFSAAMETLSIDGRPIYDQAGRTIIYVVYHITIKDYVSGNGADPGPQLELIRMRLQTPGQQFRYQNKGFGNLTINVGNVKDVVWGPKPRLLSWKPFGSLGSEITWEVEVAIPECTTAVYQFAYMEFNYKLSYRIDSAGYTQRTYSGHLSVPQTRQGGARTLRYTADQARENIVPVLPYKFRRSSQSFDLSEDKCKITFRIVDDELPSPLPPGVVHASGSHHITNQVHHALDSLWIGTIAAEYEMIPTEARAQPWRYFIQLATDRINRATQFGRVNKKPFPVIIISFSATEQELYGRDRSSYTMVYTFGSSLKEVLRTSGLFQPIPGTDYFAWRTSMDLAHHPRGTARLAFNPGDDKILDLCDQSYRKPVQNPPPDVTSPGTEQVIEQKCPEPEKSWLGYEQRIYEREEDATVPLKPLPQEAVPYKPNPADILGLGVGIPDPGAGDQVLRGRGGYVSPYQGSQQQNTIVQTRTEPYIIVTLEGWAMRVCYPIAKPSLAITGQGAEGITLTPHNDEANGFKTWEATRWNGLPVIAAKWRLSWIMNRSLPDGVTFVPNPIVHTRDIRR